MNIDLSNPLSNSAIQWAIIIVALLLVVIIARYFLHIVAHIVQFVVHFFWHGCGTILFILIVWYLLHYFKLI
ncbi:MAG: hypothetical protein M1282_17990 [Chloroflexi bacterium]|nr:hypothetical protein [Chloroflexota bacterium]